MNASHTALGILIAWFAALVTPSVFDMSTSGISRYVTVAAILWFLLNFIVWMAPAWRSGIVERRGPLLGFGFAFAAALVSAVVDGLSLGAAGAIGLFFYRLVVLSIPFALPYIISLPPYPRLADLGVLLFALAMPHIPGFAGYWTSLGEASYGGFFDAHFLLRSEPSPIVLGPGHLSAMAMIATYFYGTRFWSAAPLDWRRRTGDVKASFRSCGLGLAGALLGFLIQAGTSGEWSLHGAIRVPAGGSLLFGWLIIGITLAPLLEELAFRGLFQAGMEHWVPRSLKQRLPRGSLPALAVVLGALLHTAVGAFGLPLWTGLGLSLGVGVGFVRTRRLTPAIFGHAGAFLVLVVIALAVR